jgi:hypothetical protein
MLGHKCVVSAQSCKDGIGRSYKNIVTSSMLPAKCARVPWVSPSSLPPTVAWAPVPAEKELRDRLVVSRWFPALSKMIMYIAWPSVTSVTSVTKYHVLSESVMFEST